MMSSQGLHCMMCRRYSDWSCRSILDVNLKMYTEMLGLCRLELVRWASRNRTFDLSSGDLLHRGMPRSSCLVSEQ